MAAVDQGISRDRGAIVALKALSDPKLWSLGRAAASEKVRDTHVRMGLELQQAFGLQIIETPAPSSYTNWTAHSRVCARPAFHQCARRCA